MIKRRTHRIVNLACTEDLNAIYMSSMLFLTTFTYLSSPIMMSFTQGF